MIDLLVVGAGPTGLTTALEAKRLGLTVRIIDRKQERQTTQSRALVVHSRVMELLHSIDNGQVTSDIIANGVQLDKFQIYFNRSETPSVSFSMQDGCQWGDAKYPFTQFLPQYETEKALEEALERSGVQVEWSTPLESLEQKNDLVDTVVTLPNGTTQHITSRYVVGCDGGRSKVRDMIGIALDRHSIDLPFLIADVKIKSHHFDNDYGTRLFFPQDDYQLIFFAIGDEDRTYRIYGAVDSSMTRETLDEVMLQKIVAKRTGLNLDFELAGWLTVFDITHGISDSFRSGRVFLAGDASHVHSPVGGQGMNVGMMDAMNVAWKLAWATRCRNEYNGTDKDVNMILNSYKLEREAKGKELVARVEPATMFVSSQNVFIRILRRLVITFLAPILVKRNIRNLGQLTTKYKADESNIICSRQRGGSFVCNPGERLPNLVLSDGSCLYDKVQRGAHHFWVVLSPECTSVGETVHERLKVLEASPSLSQRAPPRISSRALRQQQAILVRPDLYVASIDSSLDGAWRKMSNQVGGSKAVLSSM